MIISLLGLPRSGKTAMMVLLLALIDAMRFPIVANCNLFGFSDFRKIEPIDLIYLMFCACGLDEAWSWFESRVSTSRVSRFESLLIFQSGKCGVVLPYTAQLDSSVDKRLRELADLRFACFKDVENKEFDYFPVTANEEVIYDEGFSLPFDFMVKFVYGRYDTYERKLPAGFRDLMADVARLSPDRMERLLDAQIAKVFSARSEYGLNRVRDCTRSNVEYALIRLHEPVSYAPLVARGLSLKLDCLSAVEEVSLKEGWR